MLMNVWKNLGVLVRDHTMTEGEYNNEARTAARCSKTYGMPYPHCLHHHQFMGLRVTKIQCQLPHQCHQGLIDLEAPGIHTVANDAAGSLEAI